MRYTDSQNVTGRVLVVALETDNGFDSGHRRQKFFPGEAKRIFPGEATVVKLHFTNSKTRKKQKTSEQNIKFQNSGGLPFPAPASDAHDSEICLIMTS